MKTEIRHIRLQDPGQLYLTKRDTAVDKLVLAEFAFGTLAGVISYVAAVITTVVTVPGLWRSLSLLLCLASFGCAVVLIAQGARNFGKRE
jgi:hypothetical protein